MKSIFIQSAKTRGLALIVLLAVVSTPAQTVITKLDTPTMNQPTDWSGIAPGGTTIGLFDSTLATQYGSLSLGGPVTLLGMIFTNSLVGAVVINADGNALTNGASGLDMSSANQNVTLGCDIVANGAQTWTVGNNSTAPTLTIGGNLTGAAPAIALGTNSFLIFNSTTNPTVGQVDGGGATIQSKSTTGIPTVNQNVTGMHWTKQINGVSGATINLTGISTSTNTVIGQFNTAGMLVKINGGVWYHNFDGAFTANLELDNGVFINTNRNFYFNQGNSSLTVHGGTMIITNAFGLRLGSTFGANNTGVNFTGVQDGGVIAMNKSTLEIGNLTSGKIDTYTLSGGSINFWSGIGFNIGSVADGTGSTTFTLSGTGKLYGNTTIAGKQGAGAQQVFAFNGGTLAVGTVTATLLSGAAAPTAQGTLYNNGGTLAPGDIGTPGKTTITGNYTVSSPTAMLAIDIGGTTQANAFTNAPSSYDFVSVSGTATLGGLATANLINGYTPSATSAFTNLTAGTSIVGTGTSIGYSGYVPVTVNGVPQAGKYFQAVVIGKNLILTNYGAALPPLAASFTPTNTAGGPPLPVSFTDLSTGAITNRHWNFGDTSTLDTLSTNISHTFTNIGSYTVVLTVKALDGSSANATGKVSVLTPGGTLVWKGSASSIWNTTEYDWLNSVGNLAQYQEADGVVFDDTSSVTNLTLNSPLAAPNSVTFSNSVRNYTISGTGAIKGSTGLNQAGTGEVTLLTANTYNGPTEVNGTLQLGNGVTSGSIDNTSALTNNGALIFNQSDNHTMTLNPPLVGAGSLTKAGAGTLYLGTNDNYNSGTPFTGNVFINGGELKVADYTGLGQTTTLPLSNGGIAGFSAGPSSYNYTVTMTNGGGLDIAMPVTMGSSLSGTGPFTKAGLGTMTFDQPASYTGNTFIAGGMLILGTAQSVPGAVALTGGSITYNFGDTYVTPGLISGNSPLSSIVDGQSAGYGTSAGNTNTLTFANGNNTFADIINNSAGDMVLTASANSTNALSGGNGLAYANNTTLWIESGNYVQNGTAFSGGKGSGANFTMNGGSFTAASSTGNGGAYNFQGNMFITNGNFTVTSGRLNFKYDMQQFVVAGGTVFITNAQYGLRMGATGGNGGANDPASVNFTGVQTSGTVVSSTPNAATGIELGGIGTGKVATYLLAGGIMSAGSVSSLYIGATNDSTVGSSSTFTLTNNAKLIVGANLQGGSSNGTNSVAVFDFENGTLAVGNYNATYLRDNAADMPGILVNNGGKLAPGEIGTAGRTIIIGNYAVSNSAAALEIDLGGTTPANAFQVASNAYDWVQVNNTNASVVLNGALNLHLINGFEPLAPLNSQFTILAINNGTNALGAPTITGNFANLSSGRVHLVGDATRSFAVTVTSTNVVLGNYQTPSPQAYFTYNTNNGTAPLTVTFTNVSNGAGLTNLWSFGDGGTSVSTAATVTHTYNNPGTNTVSLTVGSGLGVNTSSVSNAIAVLASGPSGQPILTNAVVGTSLVLTWGQGWLLGAQTNTSSVGLGNNWVTNTSATSPFTNTMDPTKGAVFYKLFHP